MKKIVMLLVIFLVLQFLATAENPAASKNLQTFEIKSRVFDNTRTIRVLLPPDYDRTKNGTRYPVLYFNDGLMVFDSKGPGLNIEAIMSALYQRNRIPPMIVIGVDNGACTDKTKNEIVDRADEFLPYPDGGFSPGHTYDPEPPIPHGKKYPEFLIGEVMPEVNRRYRTKTGAENTALGGFSYGGVSALYTVIARPEIFGKLLLESTPLWIGPHYELLADARKCRKWPKAVYIGAGSQETEEQAFNLEGEKNQKLLAAIIQKQSPHTRLKVIREKGATHQTAAWKKRLTSALAFLFSPEVENQSK